MFPFNNVEKKKKKNYLVLILGCSRVGANLGNKFSNEGKDVIVVDQSKDAFDKLEDPFGGFTIEGDCTDPEILKGADVEHAHIVVVATDNDNVNLMAAQICKVMFNCPNVYALLFNVEKEIVCNDLDINFIYPSKLAAREIKIKLDGIKGDL